MKLFLEKYKSYIITSSVFNGIGLVLWLVLFFIFKDKVNWDSNQFLILLLIFCLFFTNLLNYFFCKKFLSSGTRTKKLKQMNVENEYDGWLTYKEWNRKNEIFQYHLNNCLHYSRPVIIETLFANHLDTVNNPKNNNQKQIRESKVNKYSSYNFKDFNLIENKWNHPIWFRQSHEEHSVLCIGIPGTGKTALFLIPSICANLCSIDKPSMTIIDVKGELYEATAKLAIENGYNVIKLDTTNPFDSHRINPLKIIIDHWEKVIDFKEVTKIIKKADKENWKRIEFNREIKDWFKKNEKNKNKTIKNIYQIVKKELVTTDIEIDNETEFNSINQEDTVYVIDGIVFATLDSIRRNAKRYEKTYVEKSDKEIEYASQLIMSDFFKNSGNDKFWPESAKILLKSVMKLVRFEYQLNWISKEQYNFYYICNKTKNMNVPTFNNSINQMKFETEDLEEDDDWIKFISESSKCFTEGKTFDSILMSAYTSVEDFSQQWIGLIASKNEVELTKIFTEPTILYLIFSESEKNRSKFCCYILDLIWRLVEDTAKKYPRKKLPKNLYLYNDEFGNISFMNSAEPSVTLGRGFGVRAVFFIQDFDQLQKIYSKETANIIFSSCKTRIFLGSKNEDTIKKFSEGFGTIRKQKTSVSDADNKNDKSYSSSFEDKTIVNKNTLLNLPMGKAVLWTENSKPFLTQLTKPWLSEFFSMEKNPKMQDISTEQISNDFYDNSEKPLIESMTKNKNFEKEFNIGKNRISPSPSPSAYSTSTYKTPIYNDNNSPYHNNLRKAPINYDYDYKNVDESRYMKKRAVEAINARKDKDDNYSDAITKKDENGWKYKKDKNESSDGSELVDKTTNLNSEKTEPKLVKEKYQDFVNGVIVNQVINKDSKNEKSWFEKKKEVEEDEKEIEKVATKTIPIFDNDEKEIKQSKNEEKENEVQFEELKKLDNRKKIVNEYKKWDEVLSESKYQKDMKVMEK